MEAVRNIKRYMQGADVRAVKEALVKAGYLEKATHDRFGNDSFRATRRLQSDHGLTVDGIVGPVTRALLAALTAVGEDEPLPPVGLPEQFDGAKAEAIGKALAAVSPKRQEICLLALTCAADAANADRPHGFYIRGANLFDTDLTLHTMTEKRLAAYFQKTAYAPYYDNGRREMMERFAGEHGYAIPGADCSGFIVGLWRKAGVVKPGFDATADALFSRYCTPVTVPEPGDLVWKKGHIGLYVGGGFVCEAAGGAYGIRLTSRDKRKIRDFVTGKTHTLAGWTACGRPKYY